MSFRLLTNAAAWLARLAKRAITLVDEMQRPHKEWHERRAARGITLLREWLSPEQRTQFDEHQYFEVVGCHTGRSYRIQHGINGNIVELDICGRPTRGWCFVPDGDLVAGDVMLAQKIALETDERGAIAVACSFSVPRLPLLSRDELRRVYLQ